MQEQTKAKNTQPQWDEEFENFGKEAVNRVQDLVKEGNARRLVLCKANEEVLLDVPLTPAVVVGGLVTFWMPYLAVLAVVATFVAKLKVNIVRTEAIDENVEDVEIAS